MRETSLVPLGREHRVAESMRSALAMVEKPTESDASSVQGFSLDERLNEPAFAVAPPQSVITRALNGALALGVRQILVQGARVFGGILLARLLTPGEFGIFAIVLYLQIFFTAFGDAGLAASLIRQIEEPSEAEYQAVFSVQQVFVLSMSLCLWLASPYITASYHLPHSDTWLFKLSAISFIVVSFMVIPVSRLERKLAFDKIAVIEPAQAIVFYGVAVALAWRGVGAMSFAWALLARAVVGTAIANWVCPWSIGWRWDWHLIRTHMSFGIPYQGIQVASFLKDSISPVLIGLLLGTADVGYVSWAGMLAAYPVLALLVLQRVYMPAFARLQHLPARLAAFTENVIWATNAITAPLAVTTLVLVYPITRLIYGDKWIVAIPYFFLFWVANLFVASATPCMALLNALGRSQTALLFALVWMAGTWIVGGPLIWFYGPMGYAIANLVVQLSNLWLYREAQRSIPFHLIRFALPSWLIAAAAGALEYGLCQMHSAMHIIDVVSYAAIGILAYSACLFLLYRTKVQTICTSFRGAV